MNELKISRDLALPVDVVTEAIGIVATRGAGKSYTSAVLLEEADAAGVPFVVIDPNGVYWGLRSTAKGDKAGLPVYVFGGEHGDLPLEPGAGKLIADVIVDSGRSFVLDLSDMPTKAAARGFVAEFLERLHRRKARERSTLLLVVDEADEFAPQNPRGDTAKSLGAMETIAKRGRAWGLGIVMITQRTQALNKDVLDLIETLVAMRQLSERSRTAVKGWIADKDLRDEAGVIESLQSLPTGTAWVWSPLRGILQRVAVRRIRTFDSYATPRPGERRVEPSRRADVNLDQLGEQMRTSVERAKENDPAELRKQLRDLKRKSARVDELERESDERLARIRELEERQSEPERIEVPVLDGNVETLLGAVRSMHELAEGLAAAGDAVLTGAREITVALERVGTRAETVAVAPAPGRASVAGAPARAAGTQRTPSPPAPRLEPQVDGDAKFGKGERTVLEVLAEYPEGRTVNELAFLAGYSAKASTIGVILSNLRKAGYVEPGNQPVRPTAAGLEVVGGARERPTGQALLDQWLRHPRMGEGERRVLLALIEMYPNEPSHEQLCDMTGYSPTASTMGVILSKLRKLGVVEKGRRRVAPEFYEAISI
jgi:hypothetical protein